MSNTSVKTTYKTAKFHLPGLFEFYELYRIFIPLYYEHREYFYEWAEIDSIYGAPTDLIWGGGRVGFGDDDVETVLEFLNRYEISAHLTFSNSLLEEKHLSDRKCNELCERLQNMQMSGKMIQNGVIVHSELLLDYLIKHYPNLFMVSSTTKVITEFDKFLAEVRRPEFRYVVPDFRLNKEFNKLEKLSEEEKNKVEFLCNECCYIGCKVRKTCYENVSAKVLGLDCPDHKCVAPHAKEGYLFSKAMENPSFIGINDIMDTYLPMGFSNFKIEGRGLGSALILEFLLYYMVKPEFHIHVREKVYLDASLDLF